jgi:hypothetical protein
LPDPVPGQTIEDIARAEAVFLEKVAALHPQADAQPPVAACGSDGDFLFRAGCLNI